MKVTVFAIVIALAGSTFGQSKPEAPHDTGSDLLWKKLETRVEQISADSMA